MKRFNEFLANKMAIIMSSMWLFWILSVIIIVAGLMQPPDTPYTFVMFVISAGFQAIALPVLAFVSNIQGDRAEKIAKETHDTVMKELKLMREENAELKTLIVNQKSKK